jgi:hypothetical protein
MRFSNSNARGDKKRFKIEVKIRRIIYEKVE